MVQGHGELVAPDIEVALAEEGRDPQTISRSILSFGVRRDPLSSLDWFDEYLKGPR